VQGGGLDRQFPVTANQDDVAVLRLVKSLRDRAKDSAFGPARRARIDDLLTASDLWGALGQGGESVEVTDMGAALGADQALQAGLAQLTGLRPDAESRGPLQIAQRRERVGLVPGRRLQHAEAVLAFGFLETGLELLRGGACA